MNLRGLADHEIGIKIHLKGASLVVQWLRICLAMEGTLV